MGNIANSVAAESLITSGRGLRIVQMVYRNPLPTVDVIIERDSKILMIRRRNEPFKGYLALPGGFINEGETAETAMKRETVEETSLEVEPLEILGVYSDPKRDPRRHTLSIVFVAIRVGGIEKAGDDAQKLEWIQPSEMDSRQVAFDHMQILQDYMEWKTSRGTFWSTKRRNY